ncbi:MAG: hypothetical protein HZA77_05345 [Candidatus Schekmanbacteria bacterium]|nr:hypothetical protein [Candidatus Schekmanbacteria bacterium]
MKSFIFITNEGITFQPNSEAQEPDMENCQVIGFGTGATIKEAFEKMITEEEYLLKTDFNEVIGLELSHEQKEYFFLNDYKVRYS